jgi:phosphoribosylaminoimidazolecarboxamide formyltransferase / IMP cyclohydrolase
VNHDQPVRIERALLSVYDKTGLVELARTLHDLGVELVSSRSTAAAIADGGVPVTDVADITGVPPILDHRVVTLHPKIHGGLLAEPSKPEHQVDMAEYGIAPFQLVVSNLYPFGEAVAGFEYGSGEGVDVIDIGGPAMVRASAKNHAHVAVVTAIEQYAPLIDELRANDGSVSIATRRALALEAFARTAAYDASIVEWLQHDDALPRHLVVALERTDEQLRYGENPHQRGARYRRRGETSWFDTVEQHAGLALSYLNLYDADAAWKLAFDLGEQPACAIIKHANPCGAAVGETLADAYQRALDCDQRSAFGGIVAVNRPIDAATVERMVAGPQADLVVAPGYEPGVLDALIAKRKNTRLLTAAAPTGSSLDYRQVSGGFLVQDPHHFAAGRDTWKVVTKKAPTDPEWRDIEVAWRLVGHVKSNAIVLVKDGTAWGIGAGQQNRVESGEIAAKKAAGRALGGACASDAFYPFPDGVEAAAAAGVAAVIQPGGSVSDDAVIARADELGLAMVFTGERHFVH